MHFANEGPPIHLLIVDRVDLVIIFKNVSFLLIRAHHITELVLVLLQGVAGLRYWDFAVSYCIPVDSLEKGMSFDFFGTVLPGTQTFGRISIQQVNDNILGFVRHRDRQF